jgi:hypothetical protein
VEVIVPSLAAGMTADDERDAAAADLARLVRRLRNFSRRAWSQGTAEEQVRALAEALVAIGGEGHRLPDALPTHGLADVVAVVGHDALNVEGAAPAVRALLLATLDATR